LFRSQRLSNRLDLVQQTARGILGDLEDVTDAFEDVLDDPAELGDLVARNTDRLLQLTGLHLLLDAISPLLGELRERLAKPRQEAGTDPRQVPEPLQQRGKARTCLLETRSHVPERLADRVDGLSGPAEPQNVLEDTIETLSQALQTLPKRRNGRSPQSTDVPVQPSPKVLLDDPTHKLKFRAEAPEGHRSLTRVRGELLQ